MPGQYERERLARAIAEAKNWTDLMSRLGLKKSGGQRRVLQGKVAEHGLDTSHFKKRSPWQKYPDVAIAAAVASSSSLREVVTELGAPPASGTLSHISRRIAAAGIDTSHFRNARLAIPEAALRDAVPRASSYADVMRALGLEVKDSNHRRARRKVLQLKLDTSHFTRRSWASTQVREPKAVAPTTLVVKPQGSGRTKRDRLHQALQEIGIVYRCDSCGNRGKWLKRSFTLQIDHVNGDWLDNRAENLRYLPELPRAYGNLVPEEDSRLHVSEWRPVCATNTPARYDGST
ncbi:HNH endonuclease [Streptomyces sp. ITFR-6]|uniref:HNH endonuclease n=1 Tax=Streptomyces sp. ITFR-6 TaxID=3075197 RepID=UPI00288C27B7|nr:HNH endonuclease [Streptomyces sp. ITFR-6]WNI31694.1 HNH endonuclease [Streptomyces sp. ITFR-6]